MEDASPNRGLASFQRELASPIDNLASPLTRIQRFTLKETISTLRRKRNIKLRRRPFLLIFTPIPEPNPLQIAVKTFFLVFTVIWGQNLFRLWMKTFSFFFFEFGGNFPSQMKEL